MFQQSSNRKRTSFVACSFLALLCYLSTPYLTVLTPSGIVDAFSSSLFIIATCYAALLLPKPIDRMVVAVLLIAYISYNIANKFYFDLQQTFLSIHTLYLATEASTYARSLPTSMLISISIAVVVSFIALFWAAEKARPHRRRTSALLLTLLAGQFLALQMGYANLADETNLRRGDNSPIGHMIRSTGVLPFIELDIEFTAAHRRAAVIDRMRLSPTEQLPRDLSAENLGELLGFGPDYAEQISDPRYPLYRQPQNDIALAAALPKKKPNIILLVLESVRASEMGLYGAEKTATPFLDSLAVDNVYAERFYATANFTVKSEHAIHCSALDFMIGEPLSKRGTENNSECLPQTLSDNGYRTLWFHGNDKDFYSRGQYLPKIGFKEIYSSDELDPDNSAQILGWGMKDTEIFETALNKLENVNEPFLAEILSVSNHMPFDYEWNIEFPAYLQSQDSKLDLYRRGIYYTDRAAKLFYKKFSQSPLADNTILVITGDHGIWTFGEEVESALQKNEQFFRVPFIMVTPDKMNQSIPGITSHLDIAPTIVQMLGLDSTADNLGQSLFSSNSHKKQRITYLMGEKRLSYRYEDRACLPTVECSEEEQCYSDGTESVSPVMCFHHNAKHDLLSNPKVVAVSPSEKLIRKDRSLFDYAQIALELGTRPDTDTPPLQESGEKK